MTICADEGLTRESSTKKSSIAASSNVFRPVIFGGSMATQV